MDARSRNRLLPGCPRCGHPVCGRFCDLSPTALADYNSLGHTVSFLKGASLFHEDDRGDRVFVLCSGYVRISCVSREGRAMNLKIAAPGDLIGLSAVILGNKFETSAEALSAVTARIIRRPDFIDFLNRRSEASLRAARAISEDYKSIFADARRIALSSSVPGRLASLLLELERVFNSGRTQTEFTMDLTHDDLANFIATTRETVTRTLGSFQKDRFIAIRGSSVHILARERLAALAS